MLKNWITAALTIAGLALTSQAWVIVEDDFNRDDGVLGGNWLQLSAPYSISGNEAVRSSGTGAAITWNTTYQTLNGPDQSFTAAVTAKLDSTGSGCIGLAFNVQKSNQYYVLRYFGDGNVQVLRVFEGTTVVYNPIGVEFTHVQNRPYRLEVSSDTPYTFDMKITDTVTDTVVWYETITDTNETFTGGYAGLYSNDSAIGTDPRDALSRFVIATIQMGADRMSWWPTKPSPTATTSCTPVRTCFTEPGFRWPQTPEPGPPSRLRCRSIRRPDSSGWRRLCRRVRSAWLPQRLTASKIGSFKRTDQKVVYGKH